jgi:hypothetical protein
VSCQDAYFVRITNIIRKCKSLDSRVKFLLQVRFAFPSGVAA